MIESGNIAHNKPDTNINDDQDTISNYYDTLDSMSNTISEATDNDIHEITNPMLNSMIPGTDTASYETVYEDIESSSDSTSDVINKSDEVEKPHHDNDDDNDEDEDDNNENDNDENDNDEDEDTQEELEEANIYPLHEDFDIIDKTESDDTFNHSHIEKKLKIMTNPMHDSKINYEDIDKLQTGDIILCHGNKDDSLIDKAIEYFTHSPWEHAAMVIRDPWWINDKLEDGIYVFQSGSGPNSYPDVISGSKTGVTLNKIDDFLRNRQGVYIRTLNNFQLDGGKKFLFKTAFETAHGKPYDTKPEHWTATCLGSFFRCPCISRNMVPREKQEFWCSALVSFMYTKMEWTNNETDWSCQTPNDLLSIKLVDPYTLSDIWKLK